ncbi:MAG: fructoselysine 3-epimerase [Firmicutes bacterium ADurb.Bin182]|nr:MAG: fructoselysine 3-epimerase [Firmicutes bacterium ADurb.Bin182]
MEIGISTASFYARMHPEDAVDFIASTGCGISEIFLNTYSEYEPDFIDQIKKKISANSLRIFSVHPMGTQFEPQLFSVNSRQRQDACAIFKKVLEAAQTLGAGYYVMHGPAGIRHSAKNTRLDWIGPILHELCEVAKLFGVALSWENVSWGLFNNPDFARRIVEYSKADNLTFTLDIKQAARSGYSPFDYADAMQERIANVHVCDYITNGGLTLKMPGRGTFDFQALKARLHDLSYDGPLIIEVYSDLYDDVNELKTSYGYLMNLLG